MPNHAYASLWCRDGSETILLEEFEKFLATVPFAATHPGFTQLVIRAVAPTEAPVVEQDLRAVPSTAAEIRILAGEHWHADSAYETRAHWDLWTYETPGIRWQLRPQPLDIFCYGEEYGEDAWQEDGHFLVEIGLEHLFTGHAGLLGSRGQRVVTAEHPMEKEFLEAMTRPETLQSYQEKTRENIRKLFHWVAQAEAAVPIQRFRLWSEGEETFEARMEEILAVR